MNNKYGYGQIFNIKETIFLSIFINRIDMLALNMYFNIFWRIKEFFQNIQWRNMKILIVANIQKKWNCSGNDHESTD